MPVFIRNRCNLYMYMHQSPYYSSAEYRTLLFIERTTAPRFLLHRPNTAIVNRSGPSSIKHPLQQCSYELELASEGQVTTYN